MFGIIVKRKLDHNKLANVFVNSLNEAVDRGFVDVKDMINEDPAFIHEPGINENYLDSFLLIVLTGNLKFLPDYFELDDCKEIKHLVLDKFASIYEMEYFEFEKIILEYEAFITRVNHPSKNTLYGMSKAIFHKFNLNQFQEDYFKSMNAPNPLFLKRMDEILMNYLWDWQAFFKKHKLQTA